MARLNLPFFAETASELRALVLRLYALVGTAFVVSLLVLGEWRKNPWPIIAVAALIGAGAVWLFVRRAPRVQDWIFPVAIVPVACCGIAYAACGRLGDVYLAVVGAPLAWAAVLFEAPVVWATLISCVVTVFAAFSTRVGAAHAAIATLLLSPIAVLVGFVVFSSANRLRVTRARLAELSARDRALLQAIPDTLARADREGRFLDVQSPPGDPLPRAREEILGHPVSEFVPREIARDMQDAIARTLSTGAVQTVAYEVAYPTGLRSFESRFAPAGNDEVIVIRRDVTRERLAEQALRASEARLRVQAAEIEREREQMALALEWSSLGHWNWDLTDDRVTYSPSWPALLGYGPNEIEPRYSSWVKLVHPEDSARVNAEVVRHVKGVAPGLDTEYRMRAKDGGWRWVHSRGRVIARDGSGRATQIAGTHADVTWRREAQERIARAERLATMSTLIRGMAHEMNNPLAIVVANLRFAMDRLAGIAKPGADADEYSSILRDAMEGANRVAEVVADLRSFTADPSTQHPAADVRKATERAVQLAREALRPCAAVITKVHSSLSVKIGHAELVQVLVSLLSNAGQATGPGPNTVHVHASALEGGRVAIEVSDTGVGMDGATLEHAFEPFYTTKGIGRGRGLGLSVCLGIVESAGGEIRLTSEVGMGTIATVIFLAAANGNELVQP